MQISGIELEDLEFDSIGSWPFNLRVFLIFSAFLATLALGYVFVLSDLYDQYQAVFKQRQETEQAFERAYDQASNLEAYKKQVISVEKFLLSLSRQLPKAPEEAELLEDLSRQAVSSGLTLQSFKPLPESQQGFYVEQPVEVALQGGYHNFGEFASSISNMARIVTMHDFKIKSLSTNPKHLDIKMTVQMYWSCTETREAK